MRLGVLIPFLLLLTDLTRPDTAIAGGAYHACLFECGQQRAPCLDDVRQAFRTARQECADAVAPRQCRRAERRRVRGNLRACRASRGDCERCCRDCLDSLLAGENACPGFGFVGFNSCRPTVCGDRRATGEEACDDGNSIDGDGCSSDCRVSAGG
jgi:cysteine-rich repeat protein